MTEREPSEPTVVVWRRVEWEVTRLLNPSDDGSRITIVAKYCGGMGATFCLGCGDTRGVLSAFFGWTLGNLITDARRLVAMVDGLQGPHREGAKMLRSPRSPFSDRLKAGASASFSLTELQRLDRILSDVAEGKPLGDHAKSETTWQLANKARRMAARAARRRAERASAKR